MTTPNHPLSRLFSLLTLLSLLASAPALSDPTTHYRYNDLGLIASIDGPRSDVEDTTTFSYDSVGNLTEIINALGHSSQITAHDASGRPLTLIDANGATTTLDYDVRGRLTSQNHAGRLTHYSYDATGNITTISHRNGQVITYHYDSAHRPIGYSDALGNQVSYTLDAAGNRLSETISDSSGTLTRRHRYVYDELNRLKQDIGAAEQTLTFHYDTNHNLTQQTDANQNPTNHAFDALNRLISTTDAASGITHYTYDNSDNLSSVTDSNGHTTTYRYDAFANLIEQHSPDTGHTVFTHDDAGNRLSQTDARGITTHYRYDALNRLTHISYPDSRLNIHYSYDENDAGQNGMGRLTSQSDASGSTEYRYDQRGNITHITTTLASHPFTFQYHYNSSDQLTQIDYPDTSSLHYHYDLAGRISQVSYSDKQSNVHPLLSELSYQPFGPLIQQQYGNGLTLNQDSDLDYQLTQLTTPTILARSYTLDNNSHITTIDDSQTNSSQQFSYDTLHRLSTADDNDANYGEIHYHYDSVGNRSQKTTTLNSLSSEHNYRYASDSNQLNQITATRISNYHYDANGNITDNGHYQFNYGDNNRLQSVSTNNQTLAHYTYNAQGQRSQKTTASATTYFLYGLHGELLAEADSTGQLSKRYLFANQQRLAMVQHPNTDALSSNPTDNLIENGSFEHHGNLNRGSWGLFTRIPGWHASTGHIELQRGRTGGIDANSGTKKLELDARYNSTLYQDIVTTANNSYTLQLAYSPRVPKRHNSDPVEVWWDGQHLATLNSSQKHWQQYQWQVTATSSTTRLELRGAGKSDSYGGLIDNVRLYQHRQSSETQTAIYYYHNDHLGTPQALTDKDQNIVWQAHYHPFGQTTLIINTIENNIRFPGQYYDPETGLYYNHYRYYDSGTARFISPDPRGILLDFSDPQRQVAAQMGISIPTVLGFNQANQLYNYAHQNPLTYTDPTGEFTPIAGAVAGTIAGAAGGLIGGLVSNSSPSQIVSAVVDGALLGGSAGFLAGLCGGCAVGAFTGAGFGLLANGYIGANIANGVNSQKEPEGCQ